MGSNLLKNLINNYEVILATRHSSDTWRIKCDLDKVTLFDLDAAPLDEVFQNKKIDTIVHCATNYGRKEVKPLELLEANLILPLKLLQLGSKAGVSSFINTDTVLDKRVNLYSLSKSQFREWLKVYSSKINCVNVALEHFFGPNDNESKFVTFIIRNILNNSDKINLTGGEQKRDFIYIDDVVSAITKIIDHTKNLKKGYLHFEIGTTKTVSIREFVTLVKNIAENECTNLNFGALPYRENEVMESQVDITEIQKLAWKPMFTLEEGLKQTISLERKQDLNEDSDNRGKRLSRC